jgi:hypothetical protein
MDEYGQNAGQGPVILPPMYVVKPASVTVFGILNIVFGGMGILCTPFSMLMLFMGDIFNMGQPNPIEIAGGYKTFLLCSSIAGICFAGWQLSLGIGLLKFKGWARRGSIIYACIALVWGIAGLILTVLAVSQGWMGPAEGTSPAAMGGMVGGLCGGAIGMIYPVLLLIFMNTAKVKEAFEAKGE